MKREVVNLLSADNKQIDEAEEKHVHLGSDNPDVQIEYQRTVIEKLKEEIQGLKQDREQRKVFSYSIFGFMCVYMTIAMVIVFLSGLGVMSLSDNVLITLLTTTSAASDVYKRQHYDSGRRDRCFHLRGKIPFP